MYLIIGMTGYITYLLLPSDSEIMRFFIADLAMMLIAYIFSVAKRNSSVYDAYWSLIPFFFILLWWVNGYEQWSFVHYMVAAVVSFWSWRLTLNWYRSWPGWMHEDWRYVDFRNQFGKHFEWINFSAIHLYPTLLVFLCMSGLFYLFNHAQSFNLLIGIGSVLAIGGTLLELLADNVLFRERNNPERTKGTCVRKGLWKYSRNPNYIGEILFWVGIALIGLGANAPWWTCIGAVVMILMFVFASIPMKEKRLMKTRTDFEAYRSEVPRYF